MTVKRFNLRLPCNAAIPSLNVSYAICQNPECKDSLMSEDKMQQEVQVINLDIQGMTCAGCDFG